MGSPGISRISQLAICVQELPRAVALYRDVLGLELLFEAPPQLAFFDCAGVRLMLSPPEGHAGTSVVYFEVPDLDLAAAALHRRGVEVVQESHRVAVVGPRELWMCFFRDTESNLLALTSRRLH